MSSFKKERKNIAYYITGHGLGHATRSLELIRGLLQTGRYCVHTVSTVDEKFFRGGLEAYGVNLVDDETGLDLYFNWFRNLDTGGIQLDAIYLDVDTTLQRYHDTIHIHRDKLIENEARWLKEHNIDLILMDTTQIAIAAGKVAGVKASFVSNFTWDFIFEEMLKVADTSKLSSDRLISYQKMIECCANDVRDCTHFIRYLGGTPLPAGFDASKISRGPLITRPVKDKYLREKLNIPVGTKVLVLGFGGFVMDDEIKDEFLPPGWICLVLRATPKMIPSDRFRAMDHDIYVPDLIYAADAVLGKIGYGFVSECLGCITPLIYIPRVHWPEEEHLEKVLISYEAGVKMPLEDFSGGNWAPYLDIALPKKNSWVIEDSLHPDHATNTIVHMIDNILDS